MLGKVLITPEAEADWRRDRETPDADDIKQIERLRERGQRGGRSSVARRSTAKKTARQKKAAS